MKIILTLCGLVAVAAASWIVACRAKPDHHGQPFRGLPSAAVSALADRPADFLKKEVRIEGVVGRQCPSSGCWFFVKDGAGKEVKVEMGDTVPRLPARTGKQATVEGQLIKYGEEYEFVGTAVEFH